ncbi:MAG: fasciclin domain-containing protein [Clostridia bacterium]|nr:fasciclin domain-containing protein [Clostridia bacterium]
MFVPSVDALEVLPDLFLETLLLDSDKNMEWIQEVLLYHMATLPVPTLRVINGMEIGMLSVGNTLILSKDVNGTLIINGREAATEETDIIAVNGVIHIIDS